MVISPEIDKMAGELTAIIGKQDLRRLALPDQLVQNLDDMLAAQVLSNLNSQRFPAEYVNNGQRPELLAVAELIMDKVEAPRLVGSPRPAARLPMHDHLAAARPLRTKRQPFFTIKPVNNIPPDRPAFALQQDVHPPIAVPDPRGDDLVHAPAKLCLRIPRAWLPLC